MKLDSTLRGKIKVAFLKEMPKQTKWEFWSLLWHMLLGRPLPFKNDASIYFYDASVINVNEDINQVGVMLNVNTNFTDGECTPVKHELFY